VVFYDYLIAFIGAGLMFALLAAGTRRLAGGCALESDGAGAEAEAACAGCAAVRPCDRMENGKE
jgi:hypothetical protein